MGHEYLQRLFKEIENAVNDLFKVLSIVFWSMWW